MTHPGLFSWKKKTTCLLLTHKVFSASVYPFSKPACSLKGRLKMRVSNLLLRVCIGHGWKDFLDEESTLALDTVEYQVPIFGELVIHCGPETTFFDQSGGWDKRRQLTRKEASNLLVPHGQKVDFLPLDSRGGRALQDLFGEPLIKNFWVKVDGELEMQGSQAEWDSKGENILGYEPWTYFVHAETIALGVKPNSPRSTQPPQ